MISIFFGDSFQDLEGTVIMGQFLFPFLAVLIVGQITITGKEGLFIYKKSPFGVGRFVKAKLLQSLLIAVPIVTIITSISIIQNPQLLLSESFGITGFMIQLIAANVFLALGLSLLNPEFSENARTQMVGLMINAQVAVFVSIGVFVASSLLWDLGILNTLFVQSAVIWILGTIFLAAGARKLNKIE
jgi:hypothetical protein